MNLNKCEYYYEEEGMGLCKDSLSGVCSSNCNIYQLIVENQKLQKEKDELIAWQNFVVEKFMKTCICKYLDYNTAQCSYYKDECVAINQCVYKNQEKVEKCTEIIEATADVLDTYGNNGIDLPVSTQEYLLKLIEGESYD